MRISRRALRAGPKRQRKKTVPVRSYCRRKARSAYQKAEQMRRSMPF